MPTSPDHGSRPAGGAPPVDLLVAGDAVPDVIVGDVPSEIVDYASKKLLAIVATVSVPVLDLELRAQTELLHHAPRAGVVVQRAGARSAAV